MTTTRFSLIAAATLAQDIRKSRFLANAANVASPESSMQFIAAVSDPGATHNCWAYRIGQHYRFADDGEPGGTAGKPILQAIDGQHFDHTVVVVTRWYGGIKLGAGGLARAYGGCAAECLRRADKQEVVERVLVSVSLPFALVPILRARLHEFSALKIDEQFDGEGVHWRLSLPDAQLAGLRIVVADISRGRSELRAVVGSRSIEFGQSGTIPNEAFG